jgi:hypothetical protein
MSYHLDLFICLKDNEQILDGIMPKENNWPLPERRPSGEVNYVSFR